MLSIGDILQNAYSGRQYKVAGIRTLHNYWVEVTLASIKQGPNADRNLTLWMRESEESPKAFRKVAEDETQARKRLRVVTESNPNRCQHCGVEGGQWFSLDTSIGAKTRRCRRCGEEKYER